MSRDETVKITSVRDGKRCSIFFVCWMPGSLVEKKKFSSTTGFKSTSVATITNNINQCDHTGIAQAPIGPFMRQVRYSHNKYRRSRWQLVQGHRTKSREISCRGARNRRLPDRPSTTNLERGGNSWKTQV